MGMQADEHVRAFLAYASAQRRRVESMCASCGAPMTSTVQGDAAQPRRQFCSPTCKQRERRKRQRAQDKQPTLST